MTFNGRGYLDRCLTALAGLEYPRDRCNVVVVDNGSTDGSSEFLASHFPWVQVLRCEQNLGFAAGNNLGFRATTSEFVVTLNNDTAVTPAWLAELVRPAIDDPTVGLCTGRLILMHDRLRVSLWPAKESGSWTCPRIAAWLDDDPTPVEFLGPADGVPLALGLAVLPQHRPARLRLSLGLTAGTSVAISVGDSPAQTHVVGADESVDLPLGADVPIRSIIQNAGSIVFRDGRGRDRGAVAGPNYHYFADDRGQFDRTEEVFAGCGASLLLRRAMLVNIGAFDERFFMYYEDTELSWRARSRGWKVVYAAPAIARHVHRGSTSAWSYRLVYYTERDRLMMLLKLAPTRVVVTEIVRSVASTTWATVSTIRQAIRGGEASRSWTLARWAALASLGWELPGLLRSRAQLQRTRTVSPERLACWFQTDQQRRK